MRRGVVVAVLAALWAPAAHACNVRATPTVGAAPLTVTYTALCDATAYTWRFGDGHRLHGKKKTVRHTYAAGRWVGSLETGEGRSALPRLTAVRLRLKAPKAGDYHSAVTLTGTVAPAQDRVRIDRGKSKTFVAWARVDRQGRFRVGVRLNGPGPYTARVLGVDSAPVSVLVRPVLEARLVGTPTVGGRIALVASLRPAAAGKLRVTVGNEVRKGRSIRIPIVTSAGRRIAVRIETLAARGYAAPRRSLDVPVVYPDLGPGSAGEPVRVLERRLAALHYAVEQVGGDYGQDTVDAVTAFQKAEGLPRTGRVDAAVWRSLERATTPAPRYPTGDHIEVDKPDQLVLLVRDGATALVITTSTAGLPGRFTPEGRFSVIRKVTGWDPSPLGVLYDPLYFVGGYAIHGSPNVPPYPASHGCVRLPMWIAARVFATVPYGEPVYVY